jgi:BCCT, betaine/carnitine/choline family transporter
VGRAEVAEALADLPAALHPQSRGGPRPEVLRDHGQSDDALTGIQNLTIIMAAPFGLVMVLLCVALTKDLRHDPLIRRDDRSQRAVEQAVSYGVETYADRFVINVGRPRRGRRWNATPVPHPGLSCPRRGWT